MIQFKKYNYVPMGLSMEKQKQFSKLPTNACSTFVCGGSCVHKVDHNALKTVRQLGKSDWLPQNNADYSHTYDRALRSVRLALALLDRAMA